VRLGDVDDQERDFPGVLLVQLVKGRNLPPERRSSVASEHQHDRLSLSCKRGQLDLRSLIQFRQRKVRRRIADLQPTGARPRPLGLKWKYEKRDRTRYLGHETGKSLGRLPHYREQPAASEHP